MGVRDAENKYQEKQRRRRGLQKTRFYCQVCARQCLDENGFSCHVKSDVHMRNLRKQLAGNEPGGGGATAAAALIARYSDQFAAAFLALLRRTHGDKPVALNRFYQEYIRDRDHVHLNSTRWRSVTAAARHLHAAGRCRLIALDPAADHTDPPAGPPAADKFLIASVPAKRPPAAPAHDDTPVDVPLAFFGDDDDDQDAPRADNDARTSRLDALVSAAQQRAAAAPVPGSPPPAAAAAAAAAAPLAGRKKLAFSLNKRKRSSNPPGPPG